jgi:hypothetical protein
MNKKRKTDKVKHIKSPCVFICDHAPFPHSKQDDKRLYLIAEIEYELENEDMT